MCGRFAFYSPSEATAALFGVAEALPVEARYNIAPTQYIAALREIDSVRELLMLRWGLVPFWAKDAAIGNRMINARAETVAEKPAFRAAYRKRRCLVLADGYYEWCKTPHGKTPYFISASNEQPFAFAGLWETWDDRESGETLRSATIITTAANEFLESLHHRMPVIVAPDVAGGWLDGSLDIADPVLADGPPLQAWPVSRTVNNARNEGEQLVAAKGEAMRPAH